MMPQWSMISALVIRVSTSSLGQGQLCAKDVVDTLITNALIIDHWGIIKADVGLKDGRIAAIGKAEFVTAEMVRPGAVVIDVGINRVDDASAPKGYRLVGDVAYGPVAEIASAITPVPGGVGPMTIAMLLQNTLQAWQQIESR